MEQTRKGARHNETKRERTKRYEKERNKTIKNRKNCQGMRQAEKESEQPPKKRVCEEI